MRATDKNGLMLITLGITLISLTQFMGCNADDEKSNAASDARKTTETSPTASSGTASSESATSTSATASSQSSCVWKGVNKNGPYYSTTGNSQYLCNSPSSPGVAQSIVYIGFYSDDSISWRDNLSDTQDRILTPVTDANCTVNAFQGSNGRMDYYNVIKESNGDLKSLTIHNWMITLNRTRDYTCTKIASYMAP